MHNYMIINSPLKQNVISAVSLNNLTAKDSLQFRWLPHIL